MRKKYIGLLLVLTLSVLFIQPPIVSCDNDLPSSTSNGNVNNNISPSSLNNNLNPSSLSPTNSQTTDSPNSPSTSPAVQSTNPSPISSESPSATPLQSDQISPSPTPSPSPSTSTEQPKQITSPLKKTPLSPLTPSSISTTASDLMSAVSVVGTKFPVLTNIPKTVVQEAPSIFNGKDLAPPSSPISTTSTPSVIQELQSLTPTTPSIIPSTSPSTTSSIGMTTLINQNTVDPLKPIENQLSKSPLLPTTASTLVAGAGSAAANGLHNLLTTTKGATIASTTVGGASIGSIVSGVVSGTKTTASLTAGKSIGGIVSETTSKVGNISTEVYKISQSVCVGKFCPNGKCVPLTSSCDSELNGISPRCPADNPVRCPDGSCMTTLALCKKFDLDCTEICPNGRCGPCTEYDGCSYNMPFQCPNGICVESVSDCYQCKDGHLRCFDGSCVSPCPYPPFYFKPINILTELIQSTMQTLIPVNTYSSPMNYTTDIKKLLDIYIEPTSFPQNTSFSVQAVPDSYVNTIQGEYLWNTNASYQLYLLSPVINITATYKGIAQTNFEPKVKLVFELLSPNDFNTTDICLGYIDTITNRWTCIPDSVESINGSIVTTYTDHFTSFALLTRVQYEDEEGTDGTTHSSHISNRTLTFSLIFGAVGLAILTIVVGVILHHRSKHGGVRKWFVFSRKPSATNVRKDNSTTNINSSCESININTSNSSINNNIDNNNNNNKKVNGCAKTLSQDDLSLSTSQHFLIVNGAEET